MRDLLSRDSARRLLLAVWPLPVAWEVHFSLAYQVPLNKTRVQFFVSTIKVMNTWNVANEYMVKWRLMSWTVFYLSFLSYACFDQWWRRCRNGFPGAGTKDVGSCFELTKDLARNKLHTSDSCTARIVKYTNAKQRCYFTASEFPSNTPTTFFCRGQQGNVGA